MLGGCISSMCVLVFRDVVRDEDPFSGGCDGRCLGYYVWWSITFF